MKFEFDPRKDQANQDKHQLSLGQAGQVWGDQDMIILPTVRDQDGEQRFKAIGLIGQRLHTVVFVRRGESIRVISFRKSNPKEARSYERPA